MLPLQSSTQWDPRAHVGALFDADGDGVAEPLYYNGFKAGEDICGPGPSADVDGCGHTSYARKLGVENMAVKAIQGPGVMIDLGKHYGPDHAYGDYDMFMRAMDPHRVGGAKGDMPP